MTYPFQSLILDQYSIKLSKHEYYLYRESNEMTKGQLKNDFIAFKIDMIFLSKTAVLSQNIQKLFLFTELNVPPKSQKVLTKHQENMSVKCIPP